MTRAARAQACSMVWEGRTQNASTPALRARPELISPRELVVAADAAAGLSSADIGARRFISVRTVDDHLGAVDRRVDIGGRDELADLLSDPLDVRR